MGLAKRPRSNHPVAVTPRPSKMAKAKDDLSNPLACINCRSKKIKCEYTPEGCQKCKKLDVPCVWPSEDQRKHPSSKSHIKDLYKRIEQLEKALEQAHSVNGSPSATVNTDDGLPQSMEEIQVHQTTTTYESDSTTTTRISGSTSISSSSAFQSSPNNIIARLCRRQWQLNSDAEGQYKFFGPTSSLHLTESVSSSILGSWGDGGCSLNENAWTVEDLDPDTQAHLLDMYWTYQHTVLQVFHKDTFLLSMKTKQMKYYSKALLYCIFACAARFSPRPELRALALPADDDLDDDQPYLIATATRYLEEELKRPGITTIQALLLLSVIQCALGRDTKGWLLTGDACRLAIDLGIHKNNAVQLTPGNLSLEDIHARQITFWGCVVFDRLWGLYLGRPYCLKDDDLSLQHRPGVESWIPSEATWESRMAFAWASLLEIVGYICDALNADQNNQQGRGAGEERLVELDQQLQAWYRRLDTFLQYDKDGPPSVAVLHMQYCSAVILLHRPTANFGSMAAAGPGLMPGPGMGMGMGMSLDCEDTTTLKTAFSRRQCVHHATEIARFLQDYRAKYGDATTLSGVSLHTISTAATTLVADMAERRSSPPQEDDISDMSFKMQCLKVCVRTLSELERTYLVAKRVRKIVQLIIRLCHLESEFLSNNKQIIPPLGNANANANDNVGANTVVMDHTHTAQDINLCADGLCSDANAGAAGTGDEGGRGGGGGGEGEDGLFSDMGLSSYSPFAFDEFLPISAQFDIFHTFDT